jgi:excisionase family DNA binding protein
MLDGKEVSVVDQEKVGLLRAAEVGKRLGFSKQQVYALAASGDLPSVKFGRAVRFDPEDVEEFIREHRRGVSKKKAG